MVHPARPQSRPGGVAAGSAGLPELISVSDGTETLVHMHMHASARACGTQRRRGQLERRPRVRRDLAVAAKLR